MSSPFYAHKLTHKTSSTAKNRLSIALLTIILGAGVTLTGCEKVGDTDADTPKVQILDDKVIVDKSLVQTSNPERYQPSYNLEGSLIPVDISDIKTPYSGDNITLHVKEGDFVEKDQVLATMDTTISENVVAYINHSFIDVLIDGVPHSIQQAEPLANTDKPSAIPNSADTRVDNADNKTTPTANKSNKTDNTSDKASNNESTTQSQAVEDTASDSTKKIEITLVFKSPIKGKVTKLEQGIKDALAKQYPEQTTTDEQNISTQDNDSTKIDDSKPDDSQSAINKSTPKQSSDNIKSKTDNNVTKQQNSDATKPKTTEPKKLNYPITQGQTLLTIGDTSQLQLIGTLPLSTKSQLSVGRSVNFTVFDVKTEFTGQISHITPAADGKNLIVRAPLIAGEKNPAALEPGMRAAMSIDYGQIELGVRLPASGIFEADLTKLSAKQPRPTNPVKGYVWVIEQDQRLSYTPVEVVQYFADSDKYLVHGISNDSLVCLADLPKDSDGKIISVN